MAKSGDGRVCGCGRLCAWQWETDAHLQPAPHNSKKKKMIQVESNAMRWRRAQDILIAALAALDNWHVDYRLDGMGWLVAWYLHHLCTYDRFIISFNLLLSWWWCWLLLHTPKMIQPANSKTTNSPTNINSNWSRILDTFYTRNPSGSALAII